MAKRKQTPIEQFRNMQTGVRHGIYSPNGPKGMHKIDPDRFDALIAQFSRIVKSDDGEGILEKMFSQRQQIFREILRKRRAGGHCGFAQWV